MATPTYAANGQRQAHRVQHRGGDRAVVEGVPDAVVATEKAPLIGPHFAQVEGRQGQASCGRRDGREEVVSQCVKVNEPCAAFDGCEAAITLQTLIWII